MISRRWFTSKVSNTLCFEVVNTHLASCLFASLGYDTAVFDATLPTTTSIIRGQTEEERARELAKTGRVAAAGNMFRFLGSMMYNSAELLLARQIARENKEKEQQEKVDRAKEKEIALYNKAEEAYLSFCRQGHLLNKLNLEELKDIVRYICCAEKKKGDTFSSHSSGKEKLKLRMAQVQPVWTKYFEFPPAAEEEDSASGEKDEIASC